MNHYKHTYAKRASILMFFANTILYMDDEYDLTIKSGRIAFILNACGHTPSSIAKLLGCAPAAIYQWIDGSTKNLKEHLLWKLSDITGYEARWISMGEGPARIEQSIRHAEQVLIAMQPDARYTAVRLLDTLAEPKKGSGKQ